MDGQCDQCHQSQGVVGTGPTMASCHCPLYVGLCAKTRVLVPILLVCCDIKLYLNVKRNYCIFYFFGILFFGQD